MQKKTYMENSFLKNFHMNSQQGRDYLDDFLI